MPNSGFEFDIPVFGYYSESGQIDKGEKIDIFVNEEAKDIGVGFDRTLAPTKEIIEVKQ